MRGLAGDALWLLPATAAAAAAGFASGSPVLFPLLAMAPAYPLMVRHLLAGRRARAVAAMEVWAAGLAVCSVWLCHRFPDRAAQVVWNGPAYADEMLHWLATGQGAESDPARFLVQHALHLGVFVALSLATASLVSIFFDTLLLNYMAYYVAQVILAAEGAPLAVVMGWHPWSILRVAAFVIIGVVLAEPLLGRLTGRGRRLEGARPWLLAAAAALILDAAIKAVLAPWWRLWLGRLTE